MRKRSARAVKGAGVPGSGDLLQDGEQFCELVAGRGRVPRRPGEVGETRPGGEGVGVGNVSLNTMLTEISKLEAPRPARTVRPRRGSTPTG
jgi:hypothetical protein